MRTSLISSKTCGLALSALYQAASAISVKLGRSSIILPVPKSRSHYIDVQNPRLGLFNPVPNCVYKLGLNREKFIPNPSANSPELVEHYYFLGMLMGMCITTQFSLELQFPRLMWKHLVSEVLSLSMIRTSNDPQTPEPLTLRARPGPRNGLQIRTSNVSPLSVLSFFLSQR